MGDDYDRAEDEYWEARSMGYSDEEIIAMDEWPKRPKDRYTVRSVTKAMERKARTSPIGEPESLLARAAREAGEAFARYGVGFDSPSYRARQRSQAKTARINEIKKDMQMINRTRVIDDLKAAIAKAQKELALLERIPPEPAERLTTFVVTFNGSKPYTYVALRIDGEWLVSGKHFDDSRWTWGGIFSRFEAINARVCYIATPTEYRHETVSH